MSGTLKNRGSSALTLAELCTGNPVTWDHVERSVRPKVRLALQRRFGTDRYAVETDGAVSSGIREFLDHLDDPQWLPKTLPDLERWLVRVAGRKLRDQIVKGHPERRKPFPGASRDRSGEENVASREATPLEELLNQETLDGLVESLHDKLDATQRTVVKKWIEEKPEDEIAKEMEISSPAVKWALARIFKIAKETLENET